MKRFAAAVAVIIAAGSAHAQERAGVDWSGTYVGLFVGGANGDATYANISNAEFYASPIAGGIAGLEAGYRYQYGAFVAGLSLDAALSGVDGLSNGFDRARFNVDWLVTANAQLGVAFGRALVYGTAGGALVGVQHDYDSGSFGGNDISYPRRTHSGYAIGGGLEYAFADKASISFELRRFVLEEMTFPQVLDVIPHTLDADFTAGTIGLNIRF